MGPDELRFFVKMIRSTMKEADRFEGVGLDLRREGGEVDFGNLVVPNWTMEIDVGDVAMKEFGEFTLSISPKGLEPGFLRPVLDLRKWSKGELAPLSTGLLMTLAKVPEHFEKGEVFRDGKYVRAFPENKSIYVQINGQAEPLRISLESAQEARRIVDKKDRALEWFETEVKPRPRRLVEGKAGN